MSAPFFLPIVHVGTDFVDLGMPGAGHFFLFRPAIDTALKLSLERLGVDSIDLYMVSQRYTSVRLKYVRFTARSHYMASRRWPNN